MGKKNKKAQFTRRTVRPAVKSVSGRPPGAPEPPPPGFVYYVDEDGFVMGAEGFRLTQSVDNQHTTSRGFLTAAPASKPDAAQPLPRQPRASRDGPGDICPICRSRIQSGQLEAHQRIAHAPKPEAPCPPPAPVPPVVRPSRPAAYGRWLTPDEARRLPLAGLPPHAVIISLTGNDPDDFLKEFCHYLHQRVSLRCLADCVIVVNQRRQAFTLANLAAVFAEQTPAAVSRRVDNAPPRRQLDTHRQCPDCKAWFLVAGYEKHVRAGCPAAKRRPKRLVTLPASRAAPAHLDDETSYADKHLGHMRREGGQFGSLPLYDDYGDESDAE
jgi:hypothetical protein